MSTSILIGPFTRHVVLASTTIQIGPNKTVTTLVFLTVSWDGTRLSMSGVEGPKRNGDCHGSCGQLALHDWSGYAAEPGIDLAKIRELWERWHCNDLRAGTPAQEAALREMRKHPVESIGAADVSFYDRARAWLAARDLLIDNGYQYGTKWLHEDVPTDVLDYFRNLPDGSRYLPGTWKRV